MNETLKKFILSNAIQILTITTAVVVTLLNTWIALKLAPVTTTVATIAIQTKANTDRINVVEKQHEELLPKFAGQEAKLDDVKSQLTHIESQLDNINQYLRGQK